MANSGPNSGGSQYFITLVPTTWLNYHHAVFGNIVEGMEIVDAIGDVATDSNDKPIDDVIIYSVQMSGIRIKENISDFELNDRELIDLSTHFQAYSGEPIEYEVTNSNPDAVTAVLNGTDLTIQPGEVNDVATIVVKAVSEEYFRELSFIVSNLDNRPIAGYGTSFSLDGVDDTMIGEPSSEVNIFSEFSISAWIKPESMNGEVKLVSKGLTAISDFKLDFPYSKKPKLSIRTESGGLRYISATEPLELGNWYHIGGTYNGKDLKLYINGEISNEISYNSEEFLSNTENSSIQVSRKTISMYDGEIENLSLWNRELSQEEIISLQSKSVSSVEDGLVCSWLFNEKFGEIAKDITGRCDLYLNYTSNIDWKISTAPYIFKTEKDTPITSRLASGYNDGLTFEIVSTPNLGTISDFNSSTGDFTYTPNSGVLGEDQIKYKVANSEGVESDIGEADIKIVDLSGIDEENFPAQSHLIDAYPNPFNPTTELTFISNHLGEGKLKVYNSRGRVVRENQFRVEKLGKQKLLLNGEGLNSGVYYIWIENGNISYQGRVVLIK